MNILRRVIKELGIEELSEKGFFLIIELPKKTIVLSDPYRRRISNLFSENLRCKESDGR
jgi:hypothetical protein